MESAIRKGADRVRVTAVRDVSRGMTVLNDSLEKIHSAVESALHIHLFVNGRFGTCSTNRTDPAGIDTLLDDAIASVKLLAPDPCRILVPEELRYKGPPQSSAHRGDIGTRAGKELLFSCTGAVFGKMDSLISITADYGDNRRWLHLSDSEGLNCTSEETWYSLSAECSVKGGGDTRPSDWDYQGGIHPGAIRKASTPRECALTAYKRAYAKRNPRKVPGGRYPMIVENRVASTLIAPLIDAISGSTLQQQNSFLMHKLGKRIASPSLTLTDDPHRKGFPGYSLFDSEGMATATRVVIEKGHLNMYFLSTYYANKMKMPPTVSSPSLLVLPGGKGDPAFFADSVKSGIFVTGFNGGNCNSATGDFSYGIEGFFVENGRITHPVHEMVVTGNMPDLWDRFLAAGNDALTTSAWQIPSLLFDNIEFSGL